MLVADDFPELGPNLVTALAGLEVDNFSHLDILVLKHSDFLSGAERS